MSLSFQKSGEVSAVGLAIVGIFYPIAFPKVPQYVGLAMLVVGCIPIFWSLKNRMLLVKGNKKMLLPIALIITGIILIFVGFKLMSDLQSQQFPESSNNSSNASYFKGGDDNHRNTFSYKGPERTGPIPTTSWGNDNTDNGVKIEVVPGTQSSAVDSLFEVAHTKNSNMQATVQTVGTTPFGQFAWEVNTVAKQVMGYLPAKGLQQTSDQETVLEYNEKFGQIVTEVTNQLFSMGKINSEQRDAFKSPHDFVAIQKIGRSLLDISYVLITEAGLIESEQQK